MRFTATSLIAFYFAAAALSKQTPLQYQVYNNSDHGNLTVSKTLFNQLEELARIVDITYCVGAYGPGIQKPFECLSRCNQFESFELVSTWNTGPLLSDSCGYIALSHGSNKRLIVAFRGTYSITNTIADLSTVPQEYVPYPGDEKLERGGLPDVPKCNNCTVHMGFHSSWKNTRDVLLSEIKSALEGRPDYKLVLVGHSLGGAVAALAGLELLARGYSPTVTTFGEPRLGNAAFANYLDMRFNNSVSRPDFESSNFRRVTHVDDPVPLLPLEEWGYMPHAGEIFISKYDLSPELEDVRHCIGQQDKSCSEEAFGSWSDFHWRLPTRLKMWQILFAHRDYFWRLGLCMPETKWEWK